MPEYQTVDELKASPEYKRLGVLGRERLLWATFPELKTAQRRASATHLTEAVHSEEEDE